MIQKLIHRLFKRRHFWRQATFGEVAELYASRVLRMAALNIAGGFLSIYLYQVGYSIFQIAFFWTVFFLAKTLAVLPVTALVARIGPKHGTLVSNLLYIPAMLAYALLPSLQQYDLWLLGTIIIFEGTSNSMYAVSYGIDFSKVKSAKHAGKELAYMNIAERVTTSIIPLVGGLLAFALGPQAVMAVSAFLFALAALPLFRTREPVRARQRLHLRGFPWRLVFRHAVAQAAIGFDVFTASIAWALFTAVTIIGVTQSGAVYAVSGLLLSVALFSALPPRICSVDS